LDLDINTALVFYRFRLFGFFFWIGFDFLVFLGLDVFSFGFHWNQILVVFIGIGLGARLSEVKVHWY
jgi:hypothetical protein